MNLTSCVACEGLQGLHQHLREYTELPYFSRTNKGLSWRGNVDQRNGREFMRKIWWSQHNSICPNWKIMKYNEFSGGAKQRHQSQQIVSSPEDSTNGVYQIATLEHCRHVMDCYGMFEIRPCADIGSKKKCSAKIQSNVDHHIPPLQRLPCTHRSPVRSDMLRSSSLGADASWFLLTLAVVDMVVSLHWAIGHQQKVVVKLIRNPFIIPWITHNPYTWMNLKTRAYHRNPSDITSSRKFCTESMKRKRFPHGNSADLLFFLGRWGFAARASKTFKNEGLLDVATPKSWTSDMSSVNKSWAIFFKDAERQVTCDILF